MASSQGGVRKVSSRYLHCPCGSHENIEKHHPTSRTGALDQAALRPVPSRARDYWELGREIAAFTSAMVIQGRRTSRSQADLQRASGHEPGRRRNAMKRWAIEPRRSAPSLWNRSFRLWSLAWRRSFSTSPSGNLGE